MPKNTNNTNSLINKQLIWKHNKYNNFAYGIIFKENKNLYENY